MARPRKYDTEHERRTAQNDTRKAQRKAHEIDFVAVDGEGFGRGRRHSYKLLGVGENQTESPSGLAFRDIAAFLYSQYEQKPEAAFVGFFLGYDFTQWFKTLPENRARILLTPAGIKSRERRIKRNLPPFPVEYAGWEFDILGMKRFKLRPATGGTWMYICDAGSFFQASLLSTIDPKKWSEPVVTEDEYAQIEEGKSHRDSASLDDNTRRYNILENIVLARLMDRLNLGFVQAGIRLKKNQWFGPGQAAQQWMSGTELPSAVTVQELRTVHLVSALGGSNRHDMRDVQETASPGIQSEDNPLEAGRKTYYGGWFEIFAHGHVPGISWEYDINSAYPYIASKLPCLRHGSWSAGIGEPGRLANNSIRIVHSRVVGSNPRIGAMSHRLPDGNIRRPRATQGWYWQHEIEASKRAGCIDDVEYLSWLDYEPCDCLPPLRGLAGLYDARLRVGKDTPTGKAYKLIYNSMYGKLAQSVGNPKFANSIYASLITAGCRTMILDAIATHPGGTDDVLMVATDGVYFRTPHNNLPISNRLGDWSVEHKENLTLFKPGVYWDDHSRRRIERGESPNFKSRGVSAREFAVQLKTIDDHFGSWGKEYPMERDPEAGRSGWFPEVKFDTGFAMITCQQALQWGKWFLAGTLGHATVKGECRGCSGNHLVQDADPVVKRHSGVYRNGIYWSEPYDDGGEVFESAPYDKRFGMPDDENEYGITPDGPVMDAWKGLLNG